MNKQKFKNILTIGTTFILLIAVIGISYAAFNYSGIGQKLNTITTGAITMNYTESTNIISMSNALLTTDTSGKKRLNAGEYFDFTIKSSIAGNTDINYEIAAKEENGNTFSGQNVKFYLTKVNSDGSEEEVMPPKTYSEDPTSNVYTGRPSDMMSLYTGNLATQGDTEIKYRLRLWVDESYNPQNDNGGLVYKVKVNVYGQTSDTVAEVEDTYCKDNGFNTLSDCMLVMNNHETSVESAKTNINAKGTPDFSKISTTDEGLFMSEDDETTSIGNSQFNSGYWDPAYVGYKYNEKFSLHESNGTTGYDGFTNTTKYSFGTGYTFDESTKKFTLTGTIKQLTWKENHDEIVPNSLYSCLETNCSIIYKVTGYESDTRMTVQPISYSSDSYIDAVINNKNSAIKSILDIWYSNNLIKYTSYLADETFCNDRSISYGSGNLMTPTTCYGSFNRLYDKKMPSLKCVQDNDKFKVSNESAKLDYPISLITADEVSMAGGVYNTMNSNYYLYNGQYFWTLSPASFSSSYSFSNVWYVLPSGGLLYWNDVTYSYDVRPVINLKPDTVISNGDGTALNPYLIK